MRGFVVPKGTEVKVKKTRSEYSSGNISFHTTKKENCFFVEEMAIDPAGIVGCGPDNVTIGGYYAQCGYYGFDRDGWTLLVHASKVQVI